MESKARDVYAFNTLKARRIVFDKEHSYFSSRLLEVESRFQYDSLSLENFSKEIFDVFEGSQIVRRVDRVCLALAYPQSHQLRIVSSFNSDRLGINHMRQGYACFVSPTSSIFQLRQGEIRYYHDIEDVCRRYNQKPIQRSLALLREMGVKSGVTISLGVSEFVSGILFLNSAELGEFDEFGDQDDAVFCLLKLVGSSAIQRFLRTSSSQDRLIAEELSKSGNRGSVFDAKLFCEDLQRVVQRRTQKPFIAQVDSSLSEDFLFPSKTMVYVLLRVLEISGQLNHRNSLTISIRKSSGDSRVEVVAQGLKLDSRALAGADDLGLLAGYTLKLEDDSLIIEAPFDLVKAGVDYSIV